MRSLSEELQTHVAGQVTTLAVCWRIERSDGVLILGTEHDRDLTILPGDSPSNPYAGTYRASAGITGSTIRSTSDMSVDNMDVEGAVNQGDLQVVDLTAADIEAGLFDDAAVSLFLVNWQAPDDGQIVLRTGYIGEIRRTAEGQYRTELRGLAQRLSQTVVRTYGASCDAELGDDRCKVDTAALTISGEVTSVTSNRRFGSLLNDGSPGTAVDVELYLPMPADIQVGDTFTIQPGCDKSVAMCKVRFSNLVNFRGHGFWTPGVGTMAEYGGQTSKVGGANPFGLADIIDRLIQEWLDRIADARPDPFASPDTPWYDGGLVTFTGGNNAGFSMEVKRTLPE